MLGIYLFIGFLDPCHYDSSSFKIVYYNSHIQRSIIIIPYLPRLGHFLHFSCIWAHCYERMRTDPLRARQGSRT